MYQERDKAQPTKMYITKNTKKTNDLVRAKSNDF